LAGDSRVGEEMSESDDERRGVGWRMEADSDGWRWWTGPFWEQRVAADSTLALVVEALRRAVNLRDACAESEWARRDDGKNAGLTARALFLVSVLNPLYERLVEERAESLGLTVPSPDGSLTEIVKQLLEAGILTPEEYQPRDVNWPGL
jgi:hypothetical protein